MIRPADFSLVYVGTVVQWYDVDLGNKRSRVQFLLGTSPEFSCAGEIVSSRSAPSKCYIAYDCFFSVKYAL